MFKSKHARLVLNEIKWRFDLSRCRVYYVHRGAPGNVKMIEGSAIKSIDRTFLILKEGMQETYIPYHRIFRIEYNNHIIFERLIRSLPKKKNL